MYIEDCGQLRSWTDPAWPTVVYTGINPFRAGRQQQQQVPPQQQVTKETPTGHPQPALMNDHDIDDIFLMMITITIIIFICRSGKVTGRWTSEATTHPVARVAARAVARAAMAAGRRKRARSANHYSSLPDSLISLSLSFSLSFSLSMHTLIGWALAHA